LALLAFLAVSDDCGLGIADCGFMIEPRRLQDTKEMPALWLCGLLLRS
jgi:hypothetical protein